MIIFLYGQDTYRSRQHLKKLMERFQVERDPQGCNVEIIDTRALPLSEMMPRILTAPFLAEKRMVVLERLLEKGEEAVQEEIIDRVQAGTLPEETVLVVWEAEGEFKKNKLFDILKKEKYAQEFALLKGARFAVWICEEFKALGAELEPGVAEKIAEHASDSWEAHHLIHQLISLVGNEKRLVSLNDVAAFTGEKYDENVFALVDAIGSRNKKRALSLLENQWQQGVSDQYLFSMLVRQFRLVASVAAAKADLERAGSSEIAQALGLHPFVVKKTLALLSRYTSAELTRVYDELVEMDYAVKTGRADMDVLMTALVSRL